MSSPRLRLVVAALSLAGALPASAALDGGCEIRAEGIIGAWLIEARTTDCPSSPERPALIRSSPFELGETLVFLASGYPGRWKHEIRLVDVETRKRLSIRFWKALQENWIRHGVEVPEAWIGRWVILEGEDPDEGGAWIAMSEPLSDREIRWLVWAPRLEASALTVLCLALLGFLGDRAERAARRPTRPQRAR